MATDDRFNARFPPGHFYSPIPDYTAVLEDSSRIYRADQTSLPGIDLRRKAQLALLERFRDEFVPRIPYAPDTTFSGQRFSENNNFFGGKDAAVLACMLMYLQPQKVLEFGSGFSSALCMDVNDQILDGKVDMRFVDPNPQRLFKLMKDEDRERYEVHACRVQDIDLDLVEALGPGDILFIDSSHVSKVGSDVNFELFEVLPRLKTGVFVHVHDIFFPFEYPKHWLDEGRAWTEAYLLRAFLQFNSAFKIEFFVSYLWSTAPESFGDHFMFAAREGGRGSIWFSRA